MFQLTICIIIGVVVGKAVYNIFASILKAAEERGRENLGLFLSQTNNNNSNKNNSDKTLE